MECVKLQCRCSNGCVLIAAIPTLKKAGELRHANDGKKANKTRVLQACVVLLLRVQQNIFQKVCQYVNAKCKDSRELSSI